MPRVSFTAHLRQQVAAESVEVAGATVREALEEIFRVTPSARSYVLDDQGAVRKHVAVIIDGEALRDRLRLSDPVSSEADIFILQALSGG